MPRPSFTLADVITTADNRPRLRALDTPTVMGEGRLYLPACLTELGWEAGDESRLWVEAGHGLLTYGADGPGKRRKVGTGYRMTLPKASLGGLRAVVGWPLVAMVPVDRECIVLLGPGALAEAADLLVVPGHVRGLIDDLADTGIVGVAALRRLGATLSSAELDALAGVSFERLRELGLLGAAAAPRDAGPAPR